MCKCGDVEMEGSVDVEMWRRVNVEMCKCRDV